MSIEDNEDDFVADNGGPAFPLQSIGPDFPPGHSGMSLRTYAAIQLRQPWSGIGWLDEMIMQAKLDEFAALAMPGVAASANHEGPCWADVYAKEAYNIAGAMIEERERRQ